MATQWACQHWHKIYASACNKIANRNFILLTIFNWTWNDMIYMSITLNKNIGGWQDLCDKSMSGLPFVLLLNWDLESWRTTRVDVIKNKLKTSKNWNIQGSWNGTIVLTNKKSQRLYASNATITKLWLATTNKAWRFYVHSKPWKEKMKNNSKPLHYILFPNPKVPAT